MYEEICRIFFVSLFIFSDSCKSPYTEESIHMFLFSKHTDFWLKHIAPAQVLLSGSRLLDPWFGALPPELHAARLRSEYLRRALCADETDVPSFTFISSQEIDFALVIIIFENKHLRQVMLPSREIVSRLLHFLSTPARFIWEAISRGTQHETPC